MNIRTFDDAKKDSFNYIEVFNNRKRKHASLGHEKMYKMNQN
jgi:hypothetical protein